MERRRHPLRKGPSPASPLSHSSPSPSLLCDISNYKTPRPHLPSPSPIFLTASKNTPSSSHSTALRRRPSTVADSKATRRLKALELEQSRSARKAELRRQNALRSFSRSLTAWLNFLLKNPRSCGCDPGNKGSSATLNPSGKRESLDGGEGVGIGSRWRNPKRQRNALWQGSAGARNVEQWSVLEPKVVAALGDSLRDVCSPEDVRERMGMYMSRKSCDEVLSMMSQVCKNIDEGRLKMKAHCPIVTDLGQKQKATGILMCYNPLWLRIGLHIVLGGDSLLLNGGENQDQEVLFLKMIIEKQFFSHTGVAKSYAYNKLVEGLYRPGYFEALGNIILKRFLLLVISLDKAKCENTLPLKYGIDGIDGGSPLLFCHHSDIKSSRQIIHEFLLDVMHGEGDLLAHLVIAGCKVNHQQLPLLEYNFNISNLFEDIQDGILLCRVIQLLQCDASILSKVVAPSDTRKKNLLNCSIALQHLKQLAVPLSDEDGVVIVAEDIANGDKELVLSILWNMFVHLQVPFLIERCSLVEEITKIKGPCVDLSSCNTRTNMSLLLKWIQVACESSSIRVDSFTSLIDGKALCSLIDYYFRSELNSCKSSKENQSLYNDELAELFDSTRNVAVNNFMFVQRVTAILGNFPEILQISDLLDQETSYDEHSVVILSVFLASVLIKRRNMDQIATYRVVRSLYQSPDTKYLSISQSPYSANKQQNSHKLRMNNVLTFESPLKGPNEHITEDVFQKIKYIQDWWHTSKVRKHYLKTKLAAVVLQTAVRSQLARKHILKMQQEWAARVIQSQFRGLIERKKYLKIKMAVSLMQPVIRAWLAMTARNMSSSSGLAFSAHQSASGIDSRYLTFMVERHSFLRIKRSVLVIQRAFRLWISRNHQKEKSTPSEPLKFVDDVVAVAVMQSHVHEEIVRDQYFLLSAQLQKGGGITGECEVLKLQSSAATVIQGAWRTFTARKFYWQQMCAATKIQSHWRGLYTRKSFSYQVGAIVKIQTCIRGLIYRRAFNRCRHASMEMQRFIRGEVVRSRLLGASHLRLGNHCYQSLIITSNRLARDIELRGLMTSVLTLQRWWREVLLRNSRALSATLIQSFIRGCCARKLADKRRHCIIVIQRWWRNILFIRTRKRSVLIIQACVRGWIARRAASCNLHHIVVIQSYWRGYLVRKSSKQQVLDICTLQKCTANIEDNMRLINRLVAALSELLGHKSTSNIRHTCAALDMATAHSKECCETLVIAGAIDILLKQVHSLNRGVPDQEVLRHVLSTLRNIVCYPQFVQLFSETPLSVETIFQELLRNKNEGFFIACEILKRLCATKQGIEAVRKLQGHVKRLKSLAQDLERKAEMLKRNSRIAMERENIMRRWRETISLLLLLVGDH